MCNAVGCYTAFSFVQGHVTEVSDTTTAIKLAPVWVFPFYRQEFGGYYGFVESVYKYIKVNIMLYLPYYFLFKHINAWFTRACLNVMCDDKWRCVCLLNNQGRFKHVKSGHYIKKNWNRMLNWKNVYFPFFFKWRGLIFMIQYF